MTVVLNTSSFDFLNTSSKSEGEPGQDVPATEMSFTELMEAYTLEPESTLSNSTPDVLDADDTLLLAAASAELNLETKGKQLAAFPQIALSPQTQSEDLQGVAHSPVTAEDVGPLVLALTQDAPTRDTKGDALKAQASLLNSGSLTVSQDNVQLPSTVQPTANAVPTIQGEGHQSRPADITPLVRSQNSTVTIPQAANSPQSVPESTEIASGVRSNKSDLSALPVTSRDLPVQSANNLQTVAENEIINDEVKHRTGFSLETIEPNKNSQPVSTQTNVNSLAQTQSVLPLDTEKASATVNVRPETTSGQKTGPITGATRAQTVTPEPSAPFSPETKVETSELNSNNPQTASVETTSDALPEGSTVENRALQIPTFATQTPDTQTHVSANSPEKQTETFKDLRNVDIVQVAEEHKISRGQSLLQNTVPPIQEAPSTALSGIKEAKAQGDTYTLPLDEIVADSVKPKLETLTSKTIAATNVSISDIPKPAIESAPILFSTGSTPVDTTNRLAPAMGATPLTQPSASQPAALQAVAQNLVHAYATQSGISIRLDPPEMGNVQINFQFDADRGITAVVRSELVETSVFLKDRAEVLQQALKDSGFDSVNLRFEQGQTDSQNEQGSRHSFEGSYGAEMEFGPTSEDDISMLSLPRQNHITANEPIDLKL